VIRKVILIELDIATGNNLLGNQIIHFVCLLAIRIAKKNTRMTPGGKLVSVGFRGGNKTNRTEGTKVRIGRRLAM